MRFAGERPRIASGWFPAGRSVYFVLQPEGQRLLHSSIYRPAVAGREFPTAAGLPNRRPDARNIYFGGGRSAGEVTSQCDTEAGYP